MQPSIQRQRGATMGGMLLGVAALGFLAMVGIKLVPPYMEFSTIKSIMGDAANDPSLAGKGRREVLSSIEKKLYINDIKAVNTADFDFKQGKRGDDLSVAYEVRTPLVGNLDAVMRFNHQVTIGDQ